MDDTCSFCDLAALWRIDGYAEDGQDGNYVYSLCCDTHMQEFNTWSDQKEAVSFYEPFYLHGYAYLTDIRSIEDAYGH